MMKRSSHYSLIIISLVVIGLLIFLSGKALDNAHVSLPTFPGSSTSTPNPNATTTSGKIGPARLYPNPELTPGDVLPVTEKEICVPGYASRTRDVPVAEKKQVYAEYGVSYPQGTGAYEVDHFISLELGGSNDIKNLFLEPAEPRPGFHEKDRVENYLHGLVCNGDLTLLEAQDMIRNDWYAVYVKIAEY